MNPSILKTRNSTGATTNLYKQLVKLIKIMWLMFLIISALPLSLYAQEPPNCADVTGPSQICIGAPNQLYEQTTCLPSTFQWSIQNDATTTASIVGSTTGSSVLVNPGSTTGTYLVKLIATSSQDGRVAEGSRSTAVTGVALSLSKEDVVCFGESTGTITATFSAGFPPYQLRIDGGSYSVQSSPYTFTGLAAGPHTVEILDNRNCTNPETITIGGPQSGLSVLDSRSDVSCNGVNTGSVTVTFNGGTPPYQVNFNGNGFQTQTSPAVYSNLAAATYNYVVRDANLCTLNGSEQVMQPTALTLGLTQTAVACATLNSGTITATFDGGTPPYQVRIDLGFYAPQSSPFTFTGLAQGPHTVYVRDANNCERSASITVNAEICVFDGCSPGFWKNHSELWDNFDDPVVQNMGALGGPQFIKSSTVLSVFGFVPAGYPSGITMHGMISQGGGGCKALGRHAVSALLSSGSGLNIDYPDGITTYWGLFTAIKTALQNGNCTGTLFNQLEKISDDDHGNCGQVFPVEIVDRTAPQNVKSEVVKTPNSDLIVNAFPNPYSEEITFNIQSRISGKAILEIFNLTGHKIKTLFDGALIAGKVQSLRFNIPAKNRSTLIYRLRVGDKTSTGKVLYIN